MSDVGGNLVAILGPTNTGKTHLAFDRLMAYQSGIFGFPLRLLARENYDKAVKRVGINNVALITGEEKFIPKEAKYFFCTVESIPKNLNVESCQVKNLNVKLLAPGGMPGRVVLFTEDAIEMLNKENLFFNPIKQKKEQEIKQAIEETTKPKKEIKPKKTKKAEVKKE